MSFFQIITCHGHDFLILFCTEGNHVWHLKQVLAESITHSWFEFLIVLNFLDFFYMCISYWSEIIPQMLNRDTVRLLSATLKLYWTWLRWPFAFWRNYGEAAQSQLKRHYFSFDALGEEKMTKFACTFHFMYSILRSLSFYTSTNCSSRDFLRARALPSFTQEPYSLHASYLSLSAEKWCVLIFRHVIPELAWEEPGTAQQTWCH